MKNALYVSSLLAFLTACQPSHDTNTAQTATDNQTTSVSTTPSTIANNDTALQTTIATPTPTLTADGKIQINWQTIDSSEPVVDKQKFAYKFPPDSIPVQNYIKAYKVDTLTAQYNLTIGMGANEPLDKILDQIGTSYVSHELTAGKDSKLIIHTTSKVLAAEHDYVLTDPFAKGLVLPIKIVPDGKKS